jgi:type II secretory pathway component PulF
MPTTLLHRIRRRLRHEWRRSWSTWATRAESAAVLRLVAASAAAGVPAATILDAWAEDGRGGQGTRLEKTARLLRQGATAAEATAQVPGVVQDDHAVALAFGERTDLLEPVVQAALEGDDLLDPTIRRSFRAALGYLGIMLLLFLTIAGFLALKVNPLLVRILEDYAEIVTMPAALNRWRVLLRWLAAYWAIPVVLLLAVAIARLFPSAWRLVTRPFARSRRIAAALDGLAVADACGRPLPEAETLLAACQVDPVLAARLRRAAAGDAGRGLATAGLVTTDEAAMIETAGDARPSVLERLAASRRARVRRRATVFAESLVPVVVLLMGAAVLLQALAVFSMLSSLIEHLA